jgi:hypothetical protein
MWLEHSFLGILKVRRACHLSWSHTFQGEKTLWIPLKVPSGPGSFVGHVPKSLSAGRDDGWCVIFFTKRHLPSPAYSLGVFGSGDVMWRWVSLPTKWPEMTGGYIHKSSCQLQLWHFQTWQLGFEKAAVYEKSPMDTYGLCLSVVLKSKCHDTKWLLMREINRLR